MSQQVIDERVMEGAFSDALGQQAWFEAMFADAWKEAQAEIEKKRQADSLHGRFGVYSENPVEFCRDEFGDTFTEDVVRVMESVRDNPVTIARSANGVGKSYAAARVAIWWYLAFPDSKVLITAAPPLENLTNILWGSIMTVLKSKGAFLKGHRVRNLKVSRYDNEESYLTGVAIPLQGTSENREAKFSGKHAPHLLFIVDEGDAVPDEVYKGIESCMSGGVARLLIMFNPRDKTGPVYMKEANGQANVVELSALSHPNVLTGNDVFPGAVTRDVTVRRYNTWTRLLEDGELEDGSCIDTPDFLVGEIANGLDGKPYPPLLGGKRKVIEPSFWYMVLGKYPSQGERQLIDEAWIDAARTRWDLYVAKYGEVPPFGVQPVLGMDIAEFGNDSNVIFPRWGGFVGRPITWGGMDIIETAEKGVATYWQYGASQIYVDSNGIGAGVPPAMVRIDRKRPERRVGGRAIRVVGLKSSEKPSPLFKSEFGEFERLRDQLWWSLREWLKNDSSAMLPPDQMLLEELRIATYQPNRVSSKIKVMDKDAFRARLKRSCDKADSLCLTFAPVKIPTWVRPGDMVNL